MRLNFSGLILIVLLAAAGAFVAAPWFAFRSLRDGWSGSATTMRQRSGPQKAIVGKGSRPAAGAGAPGAVPSVRAKRPCELI